MTENDSAFVPMTPLIVPGKEGGENNENFMMTWGVLVGPPLLISEQERNEVRKGVYVDSMQQHHPHHQDEDDHRFRLNSLSNKEAIHHSLANDLRRKKRRREREVDGKDAMWREVRVRREGESEKERRKRLLASPMVQGLLSSSSSSSYSAKNSRKNTVNTPILPRR